MGPPPCLGSIVELTLVAGIQVNQTQGCECGRARPTTFMLCNGSGKRDYPTLPIAVYGRRESYSRGLESGSDGLAPHLLQHLGAVGPALHLDSKVELTLLAWAWVNQFQDVRVGNLGLPLISCSTE